ncbi:MAG: nitrogen fixation protein NifM [Hyphomicrobiales bacterium]
MLKAGIVAHHRLRAALALYGRTMSDLDAIERAAAIREAERSLIVEAAVLESPEAAGVVIPPSALDETVSDVQSRYDSPEDFAADLAGNALDEAGLREALARELKVEAVLEKIAAGASPVEEADVRAWYDAHPDKFDQPETRLGRHILITINEDMPDNSRSMALGRIAALRAGMRGGLAEFHNLAGRHSECPSALDGGRLGRLGRGQLYPALDGALFEMMEGETSQPIESEIGFHLLFCEKIYPAGVVPYEAARGKIRTAMMKKRREARQTAWLAALLKRTATLARAETSESGWKETSHA